MLHRNNNSHKSKVSILSSTLIVGLFLLLALYPNPVHAADLTGDDYTTAVITGYSGDSVEYCLETSRHRGKTLVVIAAYDDAGRMVGIRLNSCNLNSGVYHGQQEFDRSFDTARVFVLKQQGLSPLSEAAKVEVSTTAVTPLRVSVDGTVYSLTDYRVEEGQLYLPVAGLEQVLDVTVTSGDYVNAKAVCADMASYVYDPDLDSVYIWTTLPQSAGVGYDLDAPSDKSYSDVINYDEFFTMLDAAIEIADSSKLTDWRATLQDARTSERQMTRIEGMLAVLYAAVALGEDYTEFNYNWDPLNKQIGESIWDDIESIPDQSYAPDPLPTNYPFDLIENTWYDPNQTYNFPIGFHKTDYIYDGWDLCGVAYRYGFGRESLISGLTLFDYDAAKNSMRPAELMSVGEAVNALTRLIESVPAAVETIMVALNNVAATSYDSEIITDELLDIANNDMSLPAGAASTSGLPLWNGAVWGGSYEEREINNFAFATAARQLSQNGFNCIRYMLTYQTLFNTDASQVDVNKLKKLDQLVADAMRYRIHLNIVTMSLPGRWTAINLDTLGGVRADLDLFTNEEHQREAKAVWSLLAERYKDVPNSVLSFNPLWEVQNYDLSSGKTYPGTEDCAVTLPIPYPPYTADNVAQVYSDIISAIRVQDDDRFIIYEPTANNSADDIINQSDAIQEKLEETEGFANVQLLTNFCENCYVYAEMTSTQGLHIDHHNHSMFKPGYPTAIYATQSWIAPGEPLVFRGDLPAGSQLDIHMDNARDGGTLSVYGYTAGNAAGVELGELELKPTYDGHYELLTSQLSRFYAYATSKVKLSVTLEHSYERLEVCYEGSNQAFWSGIDFILPESYTVQRWWHPSAYDNNGERDQPSLVATSTIQISPNTYKEDNPNPGSIVIDAEGLSYSSNAIWQQANAATVNNWGQRVAAFAPGSATRIENAAFSIGTTYEAALAYYGDVLDTCTVNGLGWFTNDYGWGTMFTAGWQYYVGLAGGEQRDRSHEGYVLKQLLQLYQSHMSTEAWPQQQP